ncbi:MAG: nitric oxide reductase activation protein NorD, partial [Spirochaetota bacterium]
LQRIVDASVNVIDTVALLTDRVVERYPELDGRRIRAFRFLPDFFYEATAQPAPEDSKSADLRAEADQARRRREGDDDRSCAGDRSRDGERLSGENDEESALDAAFLYDEWDHVRGQYHEYYCRLQEVVPQAGAPSPLAGRIAEQARRVRRVFESIRPDLARKEKHLHDGDEINADLLYDYLIDSRHEPSPPVRFYERPRISTRDLAVLILVDVSGSTSDIHGTTTIIDLEKQATAILAEALDSLGDRFEIGGFTTRGPQNCDYLLFKAIDDEWSDETLSRLDRARPANSTRMGVALRHAGWRLSSVEARQRLVIVITDGRPMDDRYSPETRYAQYDVRMACEENERREIHTFAISTEENSFADMEIMFPHRRFAILRDMRDLPAVLPRLYIRLTV